MRTWLLGGLSCAILSAACSSDTSHSGGSGGAANGGSTANSGGSVAAGGSGAGGKTTGAGGAVNSGGITSNSGGANAGTSSRGGSAGGGGTSAGGGAPANGGTNAGGKASGGASAGGRASGGGGGGGKSSGGSAGAAGASTGTGGGGATVGCSASATGYKLVWNDEFEGPAGSAVDAAKWTHDIGGNGWGNNELEYYTDGAANAALDGSGNLVITAKKQTMSGKDYTSARLKTQGLYSFTYGRVESRMKIPSGQGMWPAFWMLGSDIDKNSWPDCGEIDIMENIGKEPNIIHATIHGPGYSAGAGPTKQYSLPDPVASAFHVFAIEWEEGAIRWYVDDMLYSTKTKADIPSSATWVYSHPFFLLLNVAVGGGWPGNPDSTTMFPQTMTVDYVRVCQK
ncbi:MAG TPA: glycoside hydrolase family 16 protein [Polyangiaceae bacterium]|nr:glycoside hydrolase family 16 protein [Polyangiaceae bacterium]